MPNSAKINFTEQDDSFEVQSSPVGIKTVIGSTKRGPINDGSILVKSWEQFRKLYGGLISNNKFPLLCKRALDGGASLRVINVKHYTDITDAGTLSAAKATPKNTDSVVFSDPIGAGHTLHITVNAITVNQVFTLDGLTTLKAFASGIMAAIAGVDSVIVVNSTLIRILYKDGVTPGTVTVTGTGAPGAVTSSDNAILDATSTPLFSLAPKYPGANYNNLKVSLLKASNGDASFFDLQIELLGESDMTELYRNLKIPGAVTIGNSKYLDIVVKTSQLVDVTYLDLSGIVSLPIVPEINAFLYEAGSDGGNLTATDYIGDTGSKTGLSAIDRIDDCIEFAAPGYNNNTFHLAASAYASQRKDICYWADFGADYLTEDQMVAARVALGIDDTYTEFFAGGIIVPDPITGADTEISAMGDILALSAVSDSANGPWYSFAGPKRGVLKNVIKTKSGFGSNPKVLDYLANYQINTVISKFGKIMIWGNFTSQKSLSVLSFLNTRRLNISMKKDMGPILFNFLEDPNDFETWKRMYLAVKPYLDGLKSKRAIFDYLWQGDQFANTLNDLVINNPTDVGLGKYKVKLKVKDIVSLQEFDLIIVITQSSVSFEESI